MIHCPFCKVDLTDPHAIVIADAIKNSDGEKVVSMCPRCGEPLIAEPTGFRKPTADEHVELIGCTRLRQAREAYVHVVQNGPILRDLWDNYFRNKLAGQLNFTVLQDEADLQMAARDIFYSAAGMALAYLQNALSTTETLEAFEGRMMLFEAELSAYGEDRPLKESKTG